MTIQEIKDTFGIDVSSEKRTDNESFFRNFYYVDNRNKFRNLTLLGDTINRQHSSVTHAITRHNKLLSSSPYYRFLYELYLAKDPYALVKAKEKYKINKTYIKGEVHKIITPKKIKKQDDFYTVLDVLRFYKDHDLNNKEVHKWNESDKIVFENLKNKLK